MTLGKRIGLAAALIFGFVFIAGAIVLNHFLGVGTAIVAKTLCSGIFVSGRDAAMVQIQETAHLPNIFTVTIDAPNSTVEVAARWRTAQVKHWPGLGCVRQLPLLEDPAQATTTNPVLAKLSRTMADKPRLAAPDLLGTNAQLPFAQSALSKVIAQAFAEPTPDEPRNTRAVAVLWQGRLIAERYAPGITPQTPLLGWSMTKSMTSALVGLRVLDGALDIEQRALLPQWQDPQDPRSQISLDMLLRMSSGLEFNENYFSPRSDATAMLFGEHSGNMADFAASMPLAYPVDSHWSYASATTNIIQRIIRNTFPDTVTYLNYVQERLLNPLGMQHTLLEPDASGTLVGSSFGYASARDWARFGQWFLQDGVWQGQRLLPEGWVQYSTNPSHTAPKGQYGAQWWLNVGPPGSPEQRPLPKLPPSVYYASGFEGQSVMVFPEQDLVIVRLGLTFYPATFDFESFGAQILALFDPSASL